MYSVAHSKNMNCRHYVSDDVWTNLFLNHKLCDMCGCHQCLLCESTLMPGLNSHWDSMRRDENEMWMSIFMRTSSRSHLSETLEVCLRQEWKLSIRLPSNSLQKNWVGEWIILPIKPVDIDRCSLRVANGRQ